MAEVKIRQVKFLRWIDKADSSLTIDNWEYKFTFYGWEIYCFVQVNDNFVHVFTDLIPENHLFWPSHREGNKIIIRGVFRFDIIAANVWVKDLFEPLDISVAESWIDNVSFGLLNYLLLDILGLERSSINSSYVEVPLEVIFYQTGDKVAPVKVEFYQNRMFRQKLNINKLFHLLPERSLGYLYSLFRFQIPVEKLFRLITVMGIIIGSVLVEVRNKMKENVEVEKVEKK